MRRTTAREMGICRSVGAGTDRPLNALKLKAIKMVTITGGQCPPLQGYLDKPRYVRSFVKRQRRKFTKYSNVALRNKEHSRKAMGEQIIRHWPFCYSRIGYLQANGSPNVLESNYVDHLKISADMGFSQITKPFLSSHSLSAMLFVPVGESICFFGSRSQGIRLHIT